MSWSLWHYRLPAGVDVQLRYEKGNRSLSPVVSLLTVLNNTQTHTSLLKLVKSYLQPHLQAWLDTHLYTICLANLLDSCLHPQWNHNWKTPSPHRLPSPTVSKKAPEESKTRCKSSVSRCTHDSRGNQTEDCSHTRPDPTDSYKDLE